MSLDSGAECQVCRCSERPGFVAYELGFIAGYLAARGSTMPYLCPKHEAHMRTILTNRLKKSGWKKA